MARNQRKYGIVLFCIVVLAISSAMMRGEYTIASCSVYLVDKSRFESYTHDDTHPWRELMIRVWYPDEGKNYPLLLFSHGLGGQFNGDSYSSLCQTCVRAGYVVVTISHSYACKPVQFPDGRVTMHSLVEVAHSYASGREIDVWEADIEYILDQCLLYNGDQESFLYNKIDPSAIGIVGHSYGGAAAVQMCRKDTRIKAAINLDGPLRGNNATEIFNKPVLFIIGALLPYSIPFFIHPLLTNDIAWSQAMYSQEIHTIDALCNAMKGNAYKIIVNGIRHTTFSDEIFNQQTAFDSGLIDPSAAQAIIGSYMVDFFNAYVKVEELDIINC